MPSKTIVILGGGVGGLVAANQLRARLSFDHRVVLVERNREHAFAPSFLWLMTGYRNAHQVVRPVTSLVRSGVECLHANVEALDLNHRSVLTKAGELAFDYLIVALGAELAPDAILGLAAASQTFYTYDGARRLRDRLAQFPGGRIAVVVTSLPYKCPAAPHEGAMLIADYFRRRGRRADVDIHLFTPESQPMPVAGPRLGAAVAELLEAKQVRFHPLRSLVAVDPAARTMSFHQGVTESYEMLVAIPPHRAPDLVRESGLANAAGWAPVSAHTLETEHHGVFAIGDVTAIPIPGRWKPDVPLMLPKAGVFAHRQAEVVAARIAAEVEGRELRETFWGEGYCMLETGEEMAGFAYGNFFAEPAPQVELRRVGKAWHAGKVLLEKWWLAAPGWRRAGYAAMLRMGGKFYAVPVAV